MHVEKGPAEIDSRGNSEPKGSLAHKFPREEQEPESRESHAMVCICIFGLLGAGAPIPELVCAEIPSLIGPRSAFGHGKGDNCFGLLAAAALAAAAPFQLVAALCL